MHSWGSQHGQLAPSAWVSFITAALNQEPALNLAGSFLTFSFEILAFQCVTSIFITAALNQETSPGSFLTFSFEITDPVPPQLERHSYPRTRPFPTQCAHFPPRPIGWLHYCSTRSLNLDLLNVTQTMWHSQCDTDHIVASFFLSSELPYWRGTARSLFNLTLLLLLICPILPTHFPQISLLWVCSTKTPGPRAFSTLELH